MICINCQKTKLRNATMVIGGHGESQELNLHSFNSKSNILLPFGSPGLTGIKNKRSCQGQ